MSQEKKFYVYVHRYASGPKQGEVFYVGKGNGDRYKRVNNRNSWWNKIVKKYGFTAEIFIRFENEACAFSFERALIRHYGRENLCNHTDGGEGVSGLRHSDETKKKLRGPRPNANIFLRGKKIPDWWKEKLRDAKLGKPQSKEHAEKSRNAKLGKKVEDTSKFNLDKMVRIVNDEGEVFESVNQAARVMSERLNCNASQGNISMVLTGKRKTAYGHVWHYDNDPTT